jgi:hypothetical protein
MMSTRLFKDFYVVNQVKVLKFIFAAGTSTIRLEDYKIIFMF